MQRRYTQQCSFFSSLLHVYSLKSVHSYFMEPKFKTSFIPKKSFEQPAPIKPRSSGSKGSLGILGLAGVVIFLLAAASAGGVYVYRLTLESRIEDKAVQLQEAREAFQPALIRILERLDTRLKTADQLLNNHISMSGIFPLLEQATYQDIQFGEMTLLQTSEGQVQLTMQGEARDFDVVALQSDVFGGNRHILEPVFSDLDVTEEDTVTFNVRSSINRQHLLYVNRVSAGDFDEMSDIDLPVPEIIVPEQDITQTEESGEIEEMEG